MLIHTWMCTFAHICTDEIFPILSVLWSGIFPLQMFETQRAKSETKQIWVPPLSKFCHPFWPKSCLLLLHLCASKFMFEYHCFKFEE